MRSFWIKVHLYLAAFFAPLLIIMAFSGGGYLLGFKGSVTVTPVELSVPASLALDSAALAAEVREVLADNDLVHEFEYVKVAGETVITRPTSRDYYAFDLSGQTIAVTLNQPDFQKRLIELHKGHGPLLFKDLQKFLAAGLLIMVISGLWLGLTSAMLRSSTLVTTGVGLLVFLILAFI